MSLRNRTLLAAFLLCTPAAQALAAQALAPDLKQPYRLQIVLHVADHRFLTTAIFQEQLERELRDHLQLTFGNLARIEVVRAHRLLGAVRENGLQQVLDGWDELSDRKTHFVLLDYQDGRYQLQARQHDGKTGLNSPVVRRDSTSDRRLVAYRAARLVEQDFGLVGTVIKTTGDEVEVGIQGGGLGVPLGRWLKPGEVFAIARLVRQGDKLRSTRLPWAVLQVISEPHDGVCRCRFFHRFQGERLSEDNRVAGYRCLQLATTTAPLRLRLVDDKDLHPLDGWQVHVKTGRRVVQLATNRDGLAASKQPFAHVAFVEVIKGGKRRAKFPVEIVDERTIVCRLRSGGQAESHEALELRRDVWVGRIYDDLRVAADRVTELNGLLKKSLDSALKNARDGLTALDEELRALRSERDEIVARAAELKPPGQINVREGEQRLEELRARHAELERFGRRLEEAIQEEKLSKEVIGLLARARLFEGDADYDQALALYERALALKSDQPRIEKHFRQLKEAWTPRDAAHKKARVFIYQDWPRLDASALTEKSIAQARSAFARCQEVGDTLTVRKLLRSNSIHAGNLKKQLEVLKRRVSADNEAQAQAIGRIAEALGRLHAEAAAFLKSKKKP